MNPMRRLPAANTLASLGRGAKPLPLTSGALYQPTARFAMSDPPLLIEDRPHIRAAPKTSSAMLTTNTTMAFKMREIKRPHKKNSVPL